MSIASALRSRSALWHDVLDAFGYELAASRPGAGPAELRVRAVRPVIYGGPAAVIDVAELWAAGADPDGLGTETDGCHLRAASWHAQIEAIGEAGAERLDLDRTKSPALIIHRHPLGEPNAVRHSASGLLVPARWLEHVEGLIYDAFHAD